MSRSRYRVRRLETLLPASMPPLDTLAQFTDFLRSDHARFWYSNETNYQLSLRSVLFTDTGPYRGVMARCYHRQDSFLIPHFNVRNVSESVIRPE